MLADLQNIISDKQSLVAGGAGTIVGTNVIDLRAAGTIPQGGSPIADIGRAPPKMGFEGIECRITTAVTATGATTIDFRLCQSANNDLSSPTTLISSGAIGKATLVAGYLIDALTRRLPFISARYLGANYVIAVSDVLTGAVWLGPRTTGQTTPTVTS